MRGVETQNVVLALVVGALLISFAVFQSIGVYQSLTDPTVHTIYIESIVLPVLPFSAGLYCIYISIKKAPILVVEFKQEKHKLGLSDAIKKYGLENLKAYLNNKPGVRYYATI